MGSSSWNDDFYHDRTATRAKSGTPTFAYDHAVRSGRADRKVHDTLDVRGKIRESRDSAEHPDSVAIGVVLDVTGSMASVPPIIQKKLPTLMGLLLRKGYIKDPQILIGAVGDNFSDRVPLQVGQFESGIEMDDNITNLVLEGGGGSSNQESYQDAIYFFAHRTSIDCFEKRQKKGYLFLIGDEAPYAQANVDELDKLLGVTVQSAVPTTEIVKAAQEKYEVFFIIPKGTSHFDAPWLKEAWGKLLGPQRVIYLDNPDAVCETIASTIGLLEGTLDGDNLVADLTGAGVSANITKATATALGDIAKDALARVGTGSGGSLPEKKGHSAHNERL